MPAPELAIARVDAPSGAQRLLLTHGSNEEALRPSLIGGDRVESRSLEGFFEMGESRVRGTAIVIFGWFVWWELQKGVHACDSNFASEPGEDGFLLKVREGTWIKELGYFIWLAQTVTDVINALVTCDTASNNAKPAEGEDQLALGSMAHWDYILVHSIEHAQWDGIPRQSAELDLDLLESLELEVQKPKPLMPEGVMKKFRSLDRPGASSVADILKALLKALDDAGGVASTRLVTDRIGWTRNQIASKRSNASG